jgi:hypothetical protein
MSTLYADSRAGVSLAEWTKYEQLALAPDLDLSRLVLNWTSKKVSDLDARGRLDNRNDPA